jgi:hypothetical protein
MSNTVESTECLAKVKVRITLQLTINQSVCLGVKPTLGLVTRYYYLSQGCCLVCVAPSLTRGQVCHLSVSVFSNLSVCTFSIYISCVWHSPVMYIQYKLGLFQSQHITADYALLITSISRYHSSLDTWTVIHMTAKNLNLLYFLWWALPCPI